jgi:peptidoglycan/xylan/chitin deacetylase (PgdA/CDA1 family)
MAMSVARWPTLLSMGLLLSQGHAALTRVANLTARASTSVPRGVVIEHCTVPGVVALTFDDGPFIYTEHVLDLLDQYDAKATFFINGENWSRAINDFSTPWPQILRRMDGAGHQIGSHTWSHADLSTSDAQVREYQIVELEKALFHVIGKAPTYLRPPYGSCTDDCLADTERLGYHVVNFDVDPKDYMHNDPDDIGSAMENFSRALDERQWGDSFLVLSHDSLRTTAESLVPYMLMEIKQRGYRAVTVGECLGDPAENWYWYA